MKKNTRPATRTVYSATFEDETRLSNYLNEWRRHHRINSWQDQEDAVRGGMKMLNIDDKYYESLFTYASGYLNTPFYFEYDTAVHPDGSVYKTGGIVKTVWNFLNQKVTF